VTDACTSATMSADCAIDVIIHAAPTDWINAPRFEIALAIQIPRNMGIRSGDSASAGKESLDTAGAVRVMSE
jgi:hypothetical protein